MKPFLLSVCLLALAGAAQAQPPGPPPGLADLPPGAPGAPPFQMPSGAKMPPPKTKRDFDGVWSHNFFYPGDKPFYALGRLPDISMLQPWAQAVYKQHFDGMASGKQILITSMKCLPAGIPNFMMEAHALQIIVKKKEIVFLVESDHQVRIVPIGADLKHSANIIPTWNGDAIAHWEGDTLVIDTVGLNDRSELDPMGTPHSAQLHVVERMRYNEKNELEVNNTLYDPLTFVHPWVYNYHYTKGGREATTENVGEYACAENNRDGVITREP